MEVYANPEVNDKHLKAKDVAKMFDVQIGVDLQNIKVDRKGDGGKDIEDASINI